MVFRTESGEAVVFDAYCPHLGANLGIGGQVKGDCIECPFHEWQFRASDGVCTHIPYSDVQNGNFVPYNNWIFNNLNQSISSPKSSAQKVAIV